MKEENRACFNCEHFVQHYIKNETRITAVNGGHCKKTLSLKKISSKSCDRWEKARDKKCKRKKAIQSVLRQMSRQIEEIAILLKNDDY